MKRLLLLCLALLILLPAGCSGGSPAQNPAEDAAAAEDAALAADTASAEALSIPVHMEYEDRFFDTSYVHSIDIRVPDDGTWDDFIATCEDEEYIACDLVIDGELFENTAIRAKGNSSKMRSRSSGKYSFKVEFDHFRDETFQGLDKLVLNNLCSDTACQRDYVTYRMMEAFGVASPLCSYTVLSVNGEEWGFYLAVEGMEDAFLERNYGQAYGALYKPDNLTGGGGGMGRADDVKLKYLGDDPDSYPNIFGSAKTKISRKDELRLIDSLRKINAGEDIPSAVDIDAMLRYLVVHSYVCNGDSYTGSSAHNYYLYEQDGRLSMLPWDYNEAFGDFGASGAASVVNHPIDTPVMSGTLEDRPMVAWIFEDESYIAQYHELYAQFLTQIWDSGWLADEISTTKELIEPYVQSDPRSFTNYNSFLSGTEALVTFFDLRAQSIRGQLDGSIPSTQEGQQADSSALIDTSALGGSSREMGRNSDESRSRSRNSEGNASGEASGEAQNREAGGERRNSSGETGNREAGGERRNASGEGNREASTEREAASAETSP